MATDYTEARATEELTTEHLVAGPDRRFYAFVIDRIIAWGIFAAEAYVAYVALIEPGDLLDRHRGDRRHGRPSSG
jgi:uncharacterized RDD family membrane protein YckC